MHAWMGNTRLQAFGMDRTSDKEAGNEFPSSTCDSDLKHVSPWYQNKAWLSATQNTHSQAATMPDWNARDSTNLPGTL